MQGSSAHHHTFVFLDRLPNVSHPYVVSQGTPCAASCRIAVADVRSPSLRRRRARAREGRKPKAGSESIDDPCHAVGSNDMTCCTATCIPVPPQLPSHARDTRYSCVRSAAELRLLRSRQSRQLLLRAFRCIHSRFSRHVRRVEAATCIRRTMRSAPCATAHPSRYPARRLSHPCPAQAPVGACVRAHEPERACKGDHSSPYLSNTRKEAN